MNKQCVALQEQLFADGFRSCVLKGQSVASLYGEHLSELRQSGDIDVLIDAPRKEVINYVMKHCPEVNSLMSHHIEFPIWKDTMIEMHFLPAQLCNPFKQRKLELWYRSESERNGNMGHGREDWIKPNDNAWLRFRKMVAANVRLLWHYPSETLWFPFFKLWHYPWRKFMERKLKEYR